MYYKPDKDDNPIIITYGMPEQPVYINDKESGLQSSQILGDGGDRCLETIAKEYFPPNLGYDIEDVTWEEI